MPSRLIIVQALPSDAQRGTVSFGEHRLPCALGKGGILPQELKREGDGASPAGTYPLRRVFYRADHGPAPRTALPVTAITHQMGWSDAPEDPAYNRLVQLPYSASHETLWRDDAVYDVLLVLGHNDDPPRPGWGSAIFLHVARPGYTPTEGCVALAEPDVRTLLAWCQPTDCLRIVLPGV